MNWIPVNLSFREFKKTRRALLKPGIVLDFGDEKMLVGHINQLGGQCDDCPIEAGRIVKAYAEVIDVETIK